MESKQPALKIPQFYQSHAVQRPITRPPAFQSDAAENLASDVRNDRNHEVTREPPDSFRTAKEQLVSSNGMCEQW